MVISKHLLRQNKLQKQRQKKVGNIYVSVCVLAAFRPSFSEFQEAVMHSHIDIPSCIASDARDSKLITTICQATKCQNITNKQKTKTAKLTFS